MIYEGKAVYCIILAIVKYKSQKPFVPADRLRSIREDIMSALQEQPLSAKEISGAVRIPEKDVFDHLHHIQKTINRIGLTFVMKPSECKKCGFIFMKREKLKKPGKCPNCRHESITEPVYLIK